MLASGKKKACGDTLEMLCNQYIKETVIHFKNCLNSDTRFKLVNMTFKHTIKAIHYNLLLLLTVNYSYCGAEVK